MLSVVRRITLRITLNPIYNASDGGEKIKPSYIFVLLLFLFYFLKMCFNALGKQFLFCRKQRDGTAEPLMRN